MAKKNKHTNNKSIEAQLRPKAFNEYIGQKKAVKALQLFVNAVLHRGSVAEHILLYGPPGIGKTTLAHIIAHELGGRLKITSGPAIEKTGDLAAILTNLRDNDVLFIDEIHRLPRQVEEALYPVMEEFCLDIVLGKGPAARTVRLSIPKITIVGATTRVALLSAPFRDRFGLLLRLDFYSEEEMVQIILRSSRILDLPIKKSVAEAIARRTRNTPRIGNRILKRVRDLYEVEKYSAITEDLIDRLFSILQIDEIGLTDIDTNYLRLIIDKFEGGPVGLSTLATSLAEDMQTIEEFIEPYLIQIGFVKKTHRGRVASQKAFGHFKITPPPHHIDQQSLV